MARTAADRFVARNAEYAAAFSGGDLASPPAGQVAVVTCMDARIDPYAALGLDLGEAHVIRNAGGIVSEDAIRSLTISQRLLGTREIVVIHHTQCGMLAFRDAELRDQIERETGERPGFDMGCFSDLEGDVRDSLRRLRACPFLPHRDGIRGFVYEVESGRLREVRAD